MITPGWFLCLLLLAGDSSWKDKPVAQWTEDDARQVLASSPWAQTAVPEFERIAPQAYSPANGLNVSLPGLHGGDPGVPDAAPGEVSMSMTRVLIRWESAMPVQSAEMKARNLSAPDVDEGHYAVMVMRLPVPLSKQMRHWKPWAELQRDGKKGVKSSDARVMDLADGTAVVFLFPLTAELSARDGVVIFDAHMGQVHVKHSFDLAGMVYLGRLEL